MNKQEKQQKLFREFIDYQLKPFNLKYDDVKEDPQWYMKYSTTTDKESEFREYIVERCRSVLRLSKKDAENEASWFILQWGLTTNSIASDKFPEGEYIKKKLK
jgi:hypothetical protein